MYSKVDVLRDKLKAFFIHFAFSIVLVLAAYLLVQLLWYPAPLFKATDASKLFVMILVVDLVLGPILTFVIYKKNKKTLRTDLVVIILVQLSALCYGLYSMYEARPVWIAYVADRFELVRVNDIIEEDKQKHNWPRFGPEYIYVDLSQLNESEQLDSILKETQYNISPAQRPKFYNDFDLAKPLIIKNSQDVALLNNYNDSIEVTRILKRYPLANSFIPLKAKAVDMTVLIDIENQGRIIKIVDLRPW
ncbi:TfpX/TfpZ family type IV pilin accessory protein [Psychrobacter sp. P11G3]|uniref:TfpX/TfpZ family type IV pilin accessory protein n=1 Tax=Psychrobacter sp. P11G3 TaxID=1699623 RepID=UPI0007102E06|nr:TfpX/TfpZ family type IV pilin accessory protein [Psychrobacter sp. P11G3]KRG35908.1 hypothetical protein AK824_01555 [Psychrobacter sp. P11G3]